MTAPTARSAQPEVLDVGPVGAAEFRAGMRMLASGVAVIASDADGQPVGLAATAVNSVSVHPPSLLVCVNRDASAHDGIATRGLFSVNLLGADHGPLVEVFGDSSRRHERFLPDAWLDSDHGVPVLVSATVAFVCRTTQRVEVASHSIFIGEVIEVRTHETPCEPLVYLGARVRRLVAEPS